MRNILMAALFAWMLVATEAMAQDFEKGLRAYQTYDYETALDEWRPLAEQGRANAQFNLGWMHANGTGVPKDHAEALRWYRLAAEQGYARAQVLLGSRYEYGKGVPKDHAEALRWYRLAAEQGYPLAQYFLGFMYEYGNGVPKNYMIAHMWYDIASANGSEGAGYWREGIAAKMTPAAIAETRRRARVCMASDYQECD